ncbi:MAG: thiol oxidoreductase [Proteobacteria bacterium]|nr:MAG: thiol oxidoreductase [Pseudomonadota bacterium]
MSGTERTTLNKLHIKFLSVIAAGPLMCAHTALAEDLTLLGGDLTSDANPNFAVTLPAPNISSEEARQFHLEGFVGFNRNFSGDKIDGRPIIGPAFNHNACGSCHVGDGKGRIGFPKDADGSAMIIKVSLRGLNVDGSPRNVRRLGGEQLQDRRPNGRRRFRIKLGYRELQGVYPDGEEYSLRKPVLSFKIPGLSEERAKRLVHSLRMTPPVIGMGLLESIPVEVLEALADPFDQDQDGISGKISYVPNLETGQLEVGRFGFRASQPTVKQQSAAAFFNDMGMSNEVFFDAAQGLEVSPFLMDSVVFYQQAAGVHRARNQDDPDVIAGRSIFKRIECDDCHVMTLTTAQGSVTETSDQVFHPFTDLLLHDMGPGLADRRKEFSASGREWRTTPLWGLGILNELNSIDPSFLHDGRARNLEEAILWHGGEAKKSRQNFKFLTKGERRQLIKFLQSL